MTGLLKGINTVAKKIGISVDTGKGYRALTNISEHGGQEVPHLHFIFLVVNDWKNGWAMEKLIDIILKLHQLIILKVKISHQIKLL